MSAPPSYRLVPRARAAAHALVAGATVATGPYGLAVAALLAAALPSLPWAMLSLFARPELPDPQLALPDAQNPAGALRRTEGPPRTNWRLTLTGHAAGAAGLALAAAALIGVVLHHPLSFDRFLFDVLQVERDADIGLWYYHFAPRAHWLKLRPPLFLYKLIVPCVAAACLETVLAVRMALEDKSWRA